MKTKSCKVAYCSPVLVLLLMLAGCSGSLKRISLQKLSDKDTSGLFLVNQVGYLPLSPKVALIRAKTDTFFLVRVSDGKVVYTGRTGTRKFWPYSGDSVSIADFSNFIKPGMYKLCIYGNTPCSFPFSIGDSVYHKLAKAAIKSYYFNRASIAVTPSCGGKWARKEGHPDTVVFIHPSAASSLRPAGSRISCPGGWYDAGDYNKYIVNSGITTYTLLLFYKMYPDYCKSLNTNIPESNNNIPDVLDEILWNLNWMLTMQDPNDGGVYHKLTNKNFDPFEMPDQATTPRYVVMKTTAASLDFASVMAMAYRVFSKEKNNKLRKLASKCLMAAKKAMDWALVNPKKYYVQPKDITTGQYDDNHLKDEFFWAQSELALATGDPSSVHLPDIDAQDLITPSWDRVEMLGMISLALTENNDFSSLRLEAGKRIVTFANELLAKSRASAYKVSLDFFKWGSNSDVMNQALVELVALRISHDSKYIPSIVGDMDYILGKNATTYCFVTGFGTHSPMHIHHRISASDGIADPIPGLMPGGPNTVLLNDCQDSIHMKERSLFPAKSYLDVQCSYSTNEVAINWNAPFFFVAGALDAWGLRQ